VESSASVSATRSPGLVLRKSARPATVAVAGAKVTYTFAVHNSGNVTITKIAVAEKAFSGSGKLSAVKCPATDLAPAAGFDCTATYTVSQADVDAGSVSNTATVSGIDPAGDPVTSPASTATVGVRATPALTLLKTATPTRLTKAGQHVTYRFLVTNTGNLTVHSVTVKETRFSGTGSLSAIACPVTSLAPGQHETCSADYTVTSKDLTASQLSNTAVVTGTAGPAHAVVAVRSLSSTARLAVAAGNHHTTSGGGASGVSETGVRTAALLAAALSLLLTGALVLAAARRRRT
jgi:uncharacterized repeat protein (TIGR01451 family)